VQRYINREMALDMFIRSADEMILFIEAEDGETLNQITEHICLMRWQRQLIRHRTKR
jgi:hypothetical protein